MTKKHLLGLLASGGLAAIISCDAGAPAPTTTGLAGNDCPIGTFRPVGLTDCVFPATDVFGQPIGVSDNRCVQGQPAVPPQCVSDNGDRPYLSTTSKCAPGYRFLEGACNRNGLTGGAGMPGFAGSFGTGSAGATFTGFAGDPGAAGGGSTGAGGTTGAAGSTSTGEASGAAGGPAGTGGGTSGGGGFFGAAGVGG